MQFQNYNYTDDNTHLCNISSHCATAPYNQLMAQKQLSWNPNALC